MLKCERTHQRQMIIVFFKRLYSSPFYDLFIKSTEIFFLKQICKMNKNMKNSKHME